jgi:Putative transmembrane protein (PGPGW)
VPLVIAVASGAVLALLGVVLLLPLPEVGLPLLLGGLRLLGRRYAWARSLNRRVDRAAAAVLARFRRLPTWARVVVAVVLAAVGVLVVYLSVLHLT